MQKRMWRLLRSWRAWSLLLALAAATRGSAYLVAPPSTSEALTVIAGIAGLRVWGAAFLVLAAGCVAGCLSARVAFVAHAVLGVGLNAAVAYGIAWQAIVHDATWVTTGELAVLVIIHAAIALRVIAEPEPEGTP